MYENLKDLAIIIAVAEVFGLAARKIKLPQVVGQIIAGLIIGPVLGWVHNTSYVQIFAEVGVVLLMFSAGLETDLKTLAKTGPTAVFMAVMGVFVPLVIGTAVGYLWYGSSPFGSYMFYKSTFIGVIMTATSVSITVQTLKELGKIDTKLGTTIVSAAIVDDVIGILVLSIVLGAAGGSDETVGHIVLKTVLFFIACFCLGFLLYKLFSWIDKRWPHRRRIVIFSIAFCFGLSYAAEKLFGVADITGAFISGVILCNIQDSEYVDRRVNIGSYLFFGPLFFTCIGLKTDLSMMSIGLLAFSGLFVAGAIIGKIIGCGFAAKVSGYSFKESLIAGIGMMTRGEVALVITQKGLDTGLISAEYFAPVIILIIFTSVTAPILLKVLFTGKGKDVKEVTE